MGMEFEEVEAGAKTEERPSERRREVEKTD